jgi:hypothetical protein
VASGHDVLLRESGLRDTSFSNAAVSTRRRTGINSVTAPLTAPAKWSTVGTVGVGVLGPLQVDGRENGLSPRDRVVVSAMVVRAGDLISTDALADALWATPRRRHGPRWCRAASSGCGNGWEPQPLSPSRPAIASR